jgi:ElaB/YqjD/DUF883 family membrane-anchored ribosome-binding protein
MRPSIEHEAVEENMMSSVKESADRAAAAANEKLHDAGATIRETAATTRAAASDAYRAASEKVGTAFSATGEKVNAAYSTTREKASLAADRTATGIDSNPVAALVGGLAIGAVLGAILPRTEKEAELLGPLGTRANDTAKAAFAAARTAGQERLDELGINSDSAREQVSKLLETMTQAARSAGSAAVSATKEGQH